MEKTIRNYTTDIGDFWIDNYLSADLNAEESTHWCNDFIDEFYPNELSDSELITEKYYSDKFLFQLDVAKKRFCDETKRGIYITSPDSGQWKFMLVGKGL